MSAQAAKALIPEDGSRDFEKPVREEDNPGLSAGMRLWGQVIIAEVLNLLEKRRYDACK